MAADKPLGAFDFTLNAATYTAAPACGAAYEWETTGSALTTAQDQVSTNSASWQGWSDPAVDVGAIGAPNETSVTSDRVPVYSPWWMGAISAPLTFEFVFEFATGMNSGSQGSMFRNAYAGFLDSTTIQIRSEWNGTSTYIWTHTFSSTLADGDIISVFIEYDSDTTGTRTSYVYVNGVQDGTNSTGYGSLGRTWDGRIQPCLGIVSQRYYTRALTSGERDQMALEPHAVTGAVLGGGGSYIMGSGTDGLDLAGTGLASPTLGGAGTAPVVFGQTGLANLTARAVGTGGLALDNTGAPALTARAAGSGQTQISGTGAPALTARSAASGSVTLDGSATGGLLVSGAGSDGFTLSGAGAARLVLGPGGTAAIVFGGSGTGEKTVGASGTDSFTLGGQATPIVRIGGTGQASLTFGGQIVSGNPVYGAGTSGLALSQVALGRLLISAASPGSTVDITGTAAPAALVRSAAGGGFTVDGASGQRLTVGAWGSGVLSWGGNALSRVTINVDGSATLTFTGAAGGSIQPTTTIEYIIDYVDHIPVVHVQDSIPVVHV